MTLHPTAVVEHVLGEYRSYLLTEFRARDPQLRAALEEALDQPLFLARDRTPTTRRIGLSGPGRPGTASGSMRGSRR